MDARERKTQDKRLRVRAHSCISIRLRREGGGGPQHPQTCMPWPDGNPGELPDEMAVVWVGISDPLAGPIGYTEGHKPGQVLYLVVRS